MTMKHVRIGVVGGGFGTSFYWHEHPDCTVEAVAELDAGRRKRLMDVYRCGKSYASLDELVEDKDVDAVAVFTGAPDHVRHSAACLNAGKHVFCAVPACMTLEEADLLAAAIMRTGLTYMMAETSWYHQSVITARKWHRECKFGSLFYTEAEYHHPGLESIYFDESGAKTWRYGLAPMHYPTHCTAYLLGVTGERLTDVSCIGWGDGAQALRDNAYANPFWNETALFSTENKHAFRVAVYWNVAAGGTERGQWYGDRMSFFDAHPNGLGAVVRRAADLTESDDAGFVRSLPRNEVYEQTKWWATDLLPAPLRHDSGHDGSHTFLTHEFIDALTTGRPPAIGIHDALNLTVPGIVAHQSALADGRRMQIPIFPL
jgi:predicted dehydrogenase